MKIVNQTRNILESFPVPDSLMMERCDTEVFNVLMEETHVNGMCKKLFAHVQSVSLS